MTEQHSVPTVRSCPKCGSVVYPDESRCEVCGVVVTRKCFTAELLNNMAAESTYKCPTSSSPGSLVSWAALSVRYGAVGLRSSVSRIAASS